MIQAKSQAKSSANSRAVHAVYVAIFAAGLVLVAEACGPHVVFRAYLEKTLWRPGWRQLTELVVLAPEKPDYLPYAGMSAGGGSRDLQKVRDSYRALFPDSQPNDGFVALNWPEATIAELRDLVRAASPAGEAEAHELELLRCKVELRAARPGDDAELAQVRSCFESYLSQPRPAAIISEARGWLARIDFLRGRGASASKYYLDELASETSNIRRGRLLNSLQMIEPKLEELDEYFDTPAHALFAANRITNSSYFDSLVPPLIERLEQHAGLFGQDAESSALALALMRAATRSGAPDATLRYAERIPPNDPMRTIAEYNWLVGIARYQQKDFSGAEAALTRVMNSTDADSERQKLSAANALIGTYARLNRPVNQLRAALQVASLTGGDTFDAAYLLDVQLTVSQLETYLKTYATAPDGIFTQYPQKQSSLEAVRYALAVRHARREEYGEAARIYDQLQSPRASRMRLAEKLFAATRIPGDPPERQLEALYGYAVFLSENEDRLFFNDTLWNRLQTWFFMYRNPDEGQLNFAQNHSELTPAEVARFTQLERRLRDEQEEYWRAYQILNQIVLKAGPTPLGKKAAALAVKCLRRIRTDRFGRSREIAAADIRLTRWLARQ